MGAWERWAGNSKISDLLFLAEPLTTGETTESETMSDVEIDEEAGAKAKGIRELERRLRSQYMPTKEEVDAVKVGACVNMTATLD